MTTIDEQHGYIRSLKEERAGRVAHMRELLDRAKRENRTLDGDERAALDRVEGSIRDLDEQVNHLESRISRERENAEIRVRSGTANFVQSPMNTATNTDSDELREVMRRGGGFDLPGMDRRVMPNGSIEVRDLLTTSAATGGATVPTGFVRQLREYLTTVSGIWQLRTTVLNTADGAPMTVPRNIATGTAAIVGEGTALAESDPAYGSVTLTTYKYARILQYSNEMRDDTGIDLSGHLARESARALHLGYGPTFAGGGAHTNAPQGLFNGVNVGGTSQAVATGVPSYADLVNVVYSVPSQYRNLQCQWFMNDSTVGAIRKLTDTTGQPLWQPSMQAGVPDALLGYSVVSDNNVQALGTAAGTAILFGDFSGYYLRDNGVRYEISTDFAFSTDLTTVRVIQRLDGAWVDVNGVRSMKSPTT